MKRQVVTVGPLTAGSANAVSLSQTPGATGIFLINGASATNGVATFAVARQLIVTTAADESAKTITIVGTNGAGFTISESFAGPATSTYTTYQNFKTVTSITSNAAFAGAVTVGTVSTGATDWVRFDEWAPSLISIQCTASGTVNYTVQQTLDDPNVTPPTVTPATMTWINHVDTNLVAATGSVQGNYAYLPTFARVVLNSGTGTVTATFIQASNGPI